MTRDILIGVDAGTSVLKSVAFTIEGEQIAVAGRANAYRTLPGGGVEQELARTWSEVAATLKDLAAKVPDLERRVAAIAVTGQGDGTWLIDADGEPVGDGLLWLDSRAAGIAREIIASPGYGDLYALTATGVNACNQSSQLAWLDRHQPERLKRAATAFHCKDWLYFRLTGARVTCPSEAVFCFGDFRTRDYAPAVLGHFAIEQHRRLLPPIQDGVSNAGALNAEAARATGLPEGLPVVLGYLDVLCSALGGGIYDEAGPVGCTIIGSTGMHMRLAASADKVRLNPQRTGYTMCFPVPGTLAQMQSNMAATLNIDWIVDIWRGVLAAEGVHRSRGDLLAHIDQRVMAAPPAQALYHPYISRAGERGPIMEPAARAGFLGLDGDIEPDGLTRSVLEGLGHAARDCYEAMGGVPGEIRLTGGAARSMALRAILAASLDRPLRASAREETGAAGAAMIAAVQQGIYPDMAACVRSWVAPTLRPPEAPDASLAALYGKMFPIYRQAREALVPVWQALDAARGGAGG